MSSAHRPVQACSLIALHLSKSSLWRFFPNQLLRLANALADDAQQELAVQRISCRNATALRFVRWVQATVFQGLRIKSLPAL